MERKEDAQPNRVFLEGLGNFKVFYDKDDRDYEIRAYNKNHTIICKLTVDDLPSGTLDLYALTRLRRIKTRIESEKLSSSPIYKVDEGFFCKVKADKVKDLNDIFNFMEN